MITADFRSNTVARYFQVLSVIALFTALTTSAHAQQPPTFLFTLPPLIGNTDQAHYPQDITLSGKHYNNAIASVDHNVDWKGVTAPDGTYQTWRWVLSYDLKGLYKTFTVDAGIQDNAQSDRIDHFEVHTNGKNLGITPPMHAGDSPEHFNLDVTGVMRLDLIVTSDIHDSNGGKDGAVWGDPVLFTDGSAPQPVFNQPPPPAPQANIDTFAWQDVPVNADVPIEYGVIDSMGYHLFDTQNEVIVIPFNQMFSDVNIYTLKFGRSPDNQMHFVNEGDAPVLWIPDSESLRIANVPDSQWYPVTSDFHSTTPQYLGIAPTPDEYLGMVWYPDMTLRGAFKATFGKNDRTIVNVGQYRFTIGSTDLSSWSDYDTFKTANTNGIHCDGWQVEHYQWAQTPPAWRHGFDHDHHFTQWQDGGHPENGNNNHDDHHGDNHPGNQTPGSAPPVAVMNPPHPIQIQSNNSNSGDRPLYVGKPPVIIVHPISKANHSSKTNSTGIKTAKPGFTPTSIKAQAAPTPTPTPSPSPTPTPTPSK